MKFKVNLIRAILASTLTVACAAATSASQSTQLEEVLVTAQKRTQNKQDLGISVIFGGTGLQFLPNLVTKVDTTFVKYSDLRQIIS